MDTGEAILESLTSGNVMNGSGDQANIVDVLHDLSRSANRISQAITPQNASPGQDAAGNHVASLTEAVMGMTDGLVKIANAIESLANAVAYH